MWSQWSEIAKLKDLKWEELSFSPNLIGGLAVGFFTMVALSSFTLACFWSGTISSATAEPYKTEEELAEASTVDWINATEDEAITMLSTSKIVTPDEKTQRDDRPKAVDAEKAESIKKDDFVKTADPLKATKSFIENGILMLSMEAASAAGRTDPFSPLVQPLTTSGGEGSTALPTPAPVERDVLESVWYMGFVGESDPKQNMAVLRVQDDVQGVQSMFKKAGESIYVNGKQIKIRSVSKNRIDLTVNGIKRNLGLTPIDDSAGTTTSDAGAAAGQVASANTPAATGNIVTPPPPLSGNPGGSAQQPALQEP